MKIVLDVIAAWTALDVVLLVAWHLGHVANRRPAAGPAAGPAVGHRGRDAQSALVPARSA